MANEGVYCQIKRGEKINKKLYPNAWQNTTNEELGQFLLSFVYQKPGTARGSKQSICGNKERYALLFGKTYNSNTAMLQTLETTSRLFWYYNNGITIICDNIEKQKIGGRDRSTGIFPIKNLSIVNGAQTTGTIGAYYEALSDDEVEQIFADAYVQVKVIQTKNADGKEFEKVSTPRDIFSRKKRYTGLSSEVPISQVQR